MTDANPTPLQVVEDLEAAAADELAEHREHAIMNRRLDEDLV